jgi:DNA ligase-1
LPFLPAQAIDLAAAGAEAALGPIDQWQVEWKHTGLRAQIVRQAGQVWVWSRTGDVISRAVPEVVAAAQTLPDGTVLDGQLQVWTANAPAPGDRLQQRLARKAVSRKLLADAPVRFIAFDLLALHGQDLRAQPQHRRRAALELLLVGSALHCAPLLQAADWPALAGLRRQSRQCGADGLVLKRRTAAYGNGCSQAGSAWRTWPQAPMTAHGVLVYAQAGTGPHAGLCTDCTFAVWSRPPVSAEEAAAVVDAITRRVPVPPGGLQLLSVAKANSGLADSALQALDQFVRANTVEKFGPVRSLRPALVVELAFDHIAPSPRHKSGIALHAPRMLRVRHDMAVQEADNLEALAGFAPSAATGRQEP